MRDIKIDEVVNYENEYIKYLKKPKKNGAESMQSLCPFHDDKNASFSVNLKTGEYCCFACGAKGNYTGFRAAIENISTSDAYKKILDEAGVRPEPQKAKVDDDKKYTLAQYSIEKRLPVEWLGEVWDMKNDGVGIAIPYVNEAGSVTATRSRYKNKMFRWKKGDTLSLYGLSKMPQIREAGYAILVEGESDTQSLWFHGIPALGVPGASTFRPEWLGDLKGLKVYLHHEGDLGGDTFERKFCEAVSDAGIDLEVYKISCSATVGVKDPSDLHIKYQSDEDFSAKWHNVMEMSVRFDAKAGASKIDEIIPGAPVRLRPPLGWRVDKKGIFFIEPKTNEMICVCRTPILLCNRLQSVDTGEEKIEIAFLRDGRWTHATFPRSTVFVSRAITALADIGVTATSENSKTLVKYLGALEAENIDVLELKKCVSQLGWHGKSFLPCNAGDLILDFDRSSTRWVSAYRQSGPIEEWTALVAPLRKNHVFRFLLAASFAAPLLSLINHRIFFIHNWGDSRSGKTAALKAALSVWGDPDALMVSFNATKVGLERIAGFFNDLPLGIDEKQVAGNNQQFIDGLVYMLGMGSSKVRGAKGGGVQNMQSWRTIVLTTGEEPLSSMSSHTGVMTRALEIEGAPFDNEADARMLHDKLSSIHGAAGKVFIEKVVEKYSSKAAELKELHAAMTADLMKIANKDSLATHVSSVAAVAVADMMISRWIFGEKDTSQTGAMAKTIVGKLATFQQTDIIHRAYEYLISWCHSNADSFSQHARPSFGFKDETDGAFYFFPNVFDKAVTDGGFNPARIAKGFRDRGYISVDKSEGDKRFTKKFMRNGTKYRVVCFNASEIIGEPIDDPELPFP